MRYSRRMSDEHDDDVLNSEQAQRFAWRIELPPEEASTAPEPAPLKPAPAPEERREADDELVRAVRALRSQIDRVWAMSPAKQPAATITLLEQVARQGLRAVALGGAPEACTRLARLVARHFKRLPRRDRRDYLHSLSWLRFGGPELGALLVEVARRGERDLDFMIDHGIRGRAAWRGAAGAVPELARMLAEAPSWHTRELCIRYLCAISTPDAVTAVRRALRLPHLRCRYLALSGLEPDKGELTDDDVRFLLEDALPHPLEPGFGELHSDALYGYPKRIVEVLEHVRPEGGHRPLEAILEGGGELIRREREGLDEGWALVALAKGWPERAAWWVERQLLAGSKPWQAIDAAAHLPEVQARRLLTWAATGADADRVEQAKKAFVARFGHELVVAPENGLPLPFEGRPSEQALARLTVLRGASVEAKAALASVLLGEAPDREAAALLIFLVARAWNLYALKGPDLPSGEDAWAKRLIEAFGAPAIEGLVRLAERDVAAGVKQGWMWRLMSLGSLVGEPAVERLRAAAAGALGAPTWRAEDDALPALSRLGAPRALAGRLFTIAIDTPPSDGYAARWAIEALARVEPDEALDARLLREAEAAIEGEDWPRATRILEAARERKLDGALAIAERLLEDLDRHRESGAFVDLVRSASWALGAAERISTEWVEAALCDPSSLRFRLACGFVRKDVSAPALASLRAALGSEARGGASAAEAAARLVWAGDLAASDPRVDAILRASTAVAAKPLLSMVFEHRRLAELAPFVRRALASDEGDAAGDALEDLYRDQPDGYEDLIADALARGAVHPDHVDTARFMVGEPSEAELYWQDDPDEDDDDFE